MIELQGKKALITGGSNGIGQAIAIAFAQAGAEVVFTYHQSTSGANETLSKIESFGKKGLAIKTSMEKISELENLLIQSLQFLGNIDILVNNAGTISRHPTFFDISLDDLDRIFAVNLRAPFLSHATRCQTHAATKKIWQHY